jgi:hypothetical protein
MNLLHREGVPMMGAQWYHELMGNTGSRRTIMIADQTAITGTSAALLWPLNAATSPFTNIPALDINDSGKAIRVTAGGVMTTPASAATTMTVNPRYATATGGGVSFGVSRASATAVVSLTNVAWDLHFSAVFRAIGAAASSTTGVGTGQFVCDAIGTSSTNPSGSVQFGGTSATTFDTTTDQGIVMDTILSGSASWTAATKWVLMEYLN